MGYGGVFGEDGGGCGEGFAEGEDDGVRLLVSGWKIGLHIVDAGLEAHRVELLILVGRRFEI